MVVEEPGSKTQTEGLSARPTKKNTGERWSRAARRRERVRGEAHTPKDQVIEARYLLQSANLPFELLVSHSRGRHAVGRDPQPSRAMRGVEVRPRGGAEIRSSLKMAVQD